MKEAVLDILVCPDCEQSLKLFVEHRDELEVMEGKFSCESCKKDYPITRGIPRFVDADHYTGSFGFQWNRFRQTQLDSYSGIPISGNRFQAVTAWRAFSKPEHWTLEVGSGAGRFTEVAADYGGQLLSLDASMAVEANFANNSHRNNVHIVQADLRHPPFKKERFDRVFCLGVLQHTPDPKASFNHLVSFVAKGGELAFDIYSKTWLTYFWTKYWIRFITKRIAQEKLLKGLEKVVPFLLRVHDVFRLIPGIGVYMAYLLVPVCTYKYSYPLSAEQNKQWALLDTFDMLSPEHDHPASIFEVQDWLHDYPNASVWADYGPNGIIGRLRR